MTSPTVCVASPLLPARLSGHIQTKHLELSRCLETKTESVRLPRCKESNSTHALSSARPNIFSLGNWIWGWCSKFRSNLPGSGVTRFAEGGRMETWCWEFGAKILCAGGWPFNS